MSDQSFSPFKRLPLEIQDVIWRIAMDFVGPRIVELKESPKSTGGFFGRVPGWNCQLTSPCPIPSILHACRRSRWLAKKRWRLSFAFGRGQRNPPKIFIDFARDTLFFGHGFRNNYHSLLDFEENISARNRKALCKIAFSGAQPFSDDFNLTGGGLARRLHRGFPALTNVIFVGSEKTIWGLKLQGSEKRIILFFRESALNTNLVRQFVLESRRNRWERPQIDYVSSYRIAPNTVQPIEDEEWNDFELRMRKIGNEGLS